MFREKEPLEKEKTITDDDFQKLFQERLNNCDPLLKGKSLTPGQILMLTKHFFENIEVTENIDGGTYQ